MQVFCKDGHTLVWREALQALGTLVPDASVDLMVLDPPYNLVKRFATGQDHWVSDDAYLAWCSQWLALCVRKLKPTGSLYLMAATQYMPFLDIFLRSQVTIISRIVWTYDSSG